MMNLLDLPEVIFRLIQTYLSHYDYHFFINSSKSILTDLKRRTIYFALTKTQSNQYITDEAFRMSLLSKVENGWNQIRVVIENLDLIPSHIPIHQMMFRSSIELPIEFWGNYQAIKCQCPSYLKEFPTLPKLKTLEINFDSSVKRINLSPLAHLEELTISNFFGSDITPLQHIPLITLESCYQVQDFSGFSNQKKLTVRKCPGLTDVESFRFIHELILYGCNNLKDVRPLNGVHALVLIVCMGLKDISGLGGHHRLSLYQFKGTGFDSLLHVPHVALAYTNIHDLNVLKYAKSVCLLDCTAIVDVSALRNAQKVSITTNTDVAGLEELAEVPDLTFNVQNKKPIILKEEFIKSLRSTTLKISGYHSTINSLLSFSKNIKHLQLGESERFSDFIHQGQGRLLNHLTSLCLYLLPNLLNLDGLEDIPTVRLMNCEGIKSLNGLGRNQCVEVRFCLCLEDVSSLATVPIVKIRNCRMLKNVNCLSKVPRLTFSPCTF